MLLKGPGFAQWLYDDPKGRFYEDLDLLVSPDSFLAAERELTDLGYRPEHSRLRPHERVEHHDVWLRLDGIPARVELHRTLYQIPVPSPVVWEALSQNSRVIELGGTEIPVPSEAASALIAALHAAQHGVRWAKPMEDLRRALVRADDQTWGRAAELAGQLGVADVFAVGLRLAPAGGDLSNRLGLGDRSSRLALLHAATAPDTSLGIERLVSTRGLTARLRLVAQELWPSPTFMRLWQPLARRGLPGLTAAYMWRPIWLMAKLPEGWRAWRRAAAAAGREPPPRAPC